MDPSAVLDSALDQVDQVMFILSAASSPHTRSTTTPPPCLQVARLQDNVSQAVLPSGGQPAVQCLAVRERSSSLPAAAHG